MYAYVFCTEKQKQKTQPMKATIVLLISLFSIHVSKAADGDDVNTSARTIIATAISEQLSYHDLSASFLQGIAFAEVKILETGKLEVLNVNAATAEEREIIKSKIESMKVVVSEGVAGKVFAFRFEFIRPTA